MNKSKMGARITLAFTYLCIFLLIIAVIFLPWLVTWYVETMGRSPTLATTVMLTCYPCSPFAAAALLSLRIILKNIIIGNTFCEKNFFRMRRVAYCCLIAAAIMLFAGYFYMPFYIAGGAAVFCGLMALTFAQVIKSGAESGDNISVEENKSL